MFVGFRDPRLYFYHYTPIRTAIDHILPSRTIKVGRYSRTNDPRESKDWMFSLGSNEGRDLGLYDFGELSREMSRMMQNHSNVICFSMDRHLTGDHTRDIYDRGFCKPRMWAQYAGNHSGVCLIFQREVMHDALVNRFSDHLVFHGPVQYRNRSIVPNLDDTPYAVNVDYLERLGKTDYCVAHIQTHWQRLYFEKCLDWRDEDEYRYVVYGHEDVDLFLDFGSSLVGVVFGASCEQSDIARVVELRRGSQTWFEQLVWRGPTPWVTFKLRWP